MKRILIAAIALTTATLFYAQSETRGTSTGESSPTPGTSVTTVQEDEKTPVKLEDLPAAVRKSLQEAEYEGWTPFMAYWIREGKSSYYEIELAKGEERKVVKLNDKGNKLI